MNYVYICRLRESDEITIKPVLYQNFILPCIHGLITSVYRLISITRQVSNTFLPTAVLTAHIIFDV